MSGVNPHGYLNMKKRMLFALTCVALAMAHVVPVAAREAPVRSTQTLCPDTPFATRAYTQDSGKPGPTVLIVSGLHGDEPASAYAAEQIRHWPIVSGKLIVVPRANEPALRAGKRATPNVPRDVSNANRNFPLSTAKKDSGARGVLAKGLWSLARTTKPNWVLDLHEGVDVHKRNAKSVGRTIIVARDTTTNHVARDKSTDAIAAKMLAAVNGTITNPAVQYERLTSPVDGGLARAAATHLGARAMIVETAKKGLAVSSRAMQMRLLVHTCLSELKMLAPHVRPTDVGYRNGVRAKTVVGVYDGGGTGGSGVPNLLHQLPELKDAAIARVGPTEIRAGALEGLDVLVFSGGMGGKQSKYLGKDGREHVRRFVKNGGGYVGVCAGAYLACTGFEWGLGILDARTKSNKWRRGVGPVRMHFTQPGKKLFKRDSTPTAVLYANGPILAPAGDKDVPDFETVAVYDTELAKNGTPVGFMKGSPAIARGQFGKGRVIVFGPHPEQTKGLHDLVRRAVDWAGTKTK